MEDKLNKSKPRNKAPKQWRKYMAVVAVGSVVLVGVNMYQAGNGLSTPSSGPSANLKAGNVNSLAGAEGSTSRYNEIVEQNNTAKQKEAEATGESFMPTMTANPVIIDEPIQAEPVVQTYTPPPTQAEQRGNQQASGPISDPNMLAAMEAYMGQWRTGKTMATTVYEPTVLASEESSRTSNVLTPISDVVDLLESPLKVGEILYSVNLLNVNSDQPSTPVVAEVLAGENARGRFLGGFTRENDMLVLHFSQYVDQNGNVTQVDAYAIDPKTKSASVRTSIDNHTIKRWGGLIAASFAEGLGTALAQTTNSTIESNGAVISTQEKYSNSEQAKIALGKVGERLGDHMDSQFDMPPTVKFKPDTAIGILVVGV